MLQSVEAIDDHFPPTSESCKWSSALKGLSHQEIEQITSCLRKKSYAPRTVIFHFGDFADSMLICESGRMRMYHCSDLGDEFTLFLQPEDYTVGLPSALLGDRRMVSVESVGPTVMLSLSREKLLDLMAKIPRFAINIAKLAASLHRESVYSTSPLVLDSAAVRLAKVLSRVAKHEVNEQGWCHVVTGLSQNDLASMVGVSRTWLSLTLAALEKHNLLWRKRLTIGIYNLQQLREHCMSLDGR